MLPNLTNQYISYSMAVFSANEIRTFPVGAAKMHTGLLGFWPGCLKIFSANTDIILIVNDFPTPETKY